MAHDERLADRIRDFVNDQTDHTEMRMFGGLGFLVNGNLALAASGQGGLLLRVDPAEAQRLCEEPRAQRFAMRGRELHNWLHIEVDDATSDDELHRWLAAGLRYAQSLRPK